MECERNHTCTHIHTQPYNSNSLHEKNWFSAGKAPLSVHPSQEDMGEVRAWQIQGIIKPLSSLQLSLTRLVGENERDRREFMTYPCNHRGGLSHSKIKHMQRFKKERDEARGNKMSYIFLWWWKSVEWYLHQMFSFDCKNRDRLADIFWFPLKTLKKCFFLSPSDISCGNADLIFSSIIARVPKGCPSSPKIPHLSVFEINESPQGDGIKMS